MSIDSNPISGDIYVYKYNNDINSNLNSNTDNLLNSITHNFNDANSTILNNIILYKKINNIYIPTNSEVSITLSGQKIKPIDDFLINGALNSTTDKLIPNIIKNTISAADTIGYQTLPGINISVLGSTPTLNASFKFKIQSGKITGIQVDNVGSGYNYNDIIIFKNIPGTSQDDELHISLEKYLPNSIITQNCTSALYQRVLFTPKTNNGSDLQLKLTFIDGSLQHIAVMNNGYGYYNNQVLIFEKENIIQTTHPTLYNVDVPLTNVTSDIHITLNTTNLDTINGSIITSITATKLGDDFNNNDILTIKSSDVPGSTSDAIILLNNTNIVKSVLSTLGLNNSTIIRNNNNIYKSFVPTTILSKNYNSLLSSILNNISTGPDGTFNNLITTTNGNGNNATLSITINNNNITHINVINQGYNYNINDELTIDTTQIPGISNNIVLKLNTNNILQYHSNAFTDSILQKQIIFPYQNNYKPYVDYLYNINNNLLVPTNTNISIIIKSDTNRGSEVLIKLMGYHNEQIILNAAEGVDIQFSNLDVFGNINVKNFGNVNISNDINVAGKSLFKKNLIIGPSNINSDWDGYLGIGTNNPQAPIHVETFNNNNDPSQHKVSIYASNVIYTGSYYASDSDRRIKQNIVKSNINDDYEIFNKIDVLNYKYIDSNKSDKSQKGFIAQQIKQLYPEAVDKDKGFIPNIMQESFIEADELGLFIQLINIKSNLLNKILKLIINNDILIIKISNIFDDKYYFNSTNENISKYNNVFVYGEQIEDLLSLDYNKIHCLHFNSTKKLINNVNKLQKDISIIKKFLNLI